MLNETTVLFVRPIVVVVDDGGCGDATGRVVLNCAVANDNKTKKAMLDNAVIRGVSERNFVIFDNEKLKF